MGDWWERMTAAAKAAFVAWRDIEHPGLRLDWEDLSGEAQANWYTVVQAARRAYEESSDE